jgi:hypothetical protein
MAAVSNGKNSGPREEERAELQALLASGAFARAPSLTQILTYVCEKYFQGQSDQIKEYNIAVEALNRPADFNQKQDAIVRVEALRLRKRLQQYYEGEGASHRIQILIPAGQYVPVFETHPDRQVARQPLATRWRLLAGLGVVVLIAATVAGVAVRRSTSGRSPAAARPSEPEVRTLPLDSDVEAVRILAGSSATKYIDSLGNTWVGDRHVTGGDRVSSGAGHSIFRSQDPAIFQTHREGDFQYDIPLKPGVYELHLLFAETAYGAGNLDGGGETSRLMNVTANGRPLLTEFDIISDAGGSNTADIKVFKDITPASDGSLHLRFRGSKSRACLNGLEVLPGIPGKMRPVRILARDLPYFDKEGRFWGPDRYFSGGRTVAHPAAVTGASDPELYKSERYGNFTYTIPVADGRYSVTLRFAETWFGTDQASNGGEGSRLFDVLSNGVILLKGFDIFREAGGAARAVEKVFRGLVPNAQGKLVFSFVPIKNYACLNAIEVVDESR